MVSRRPALLWRGPPPGHSYRTSRPSPPEMKPPGLGSREKWYYTYVLYILHTYIHTYYTHTNTHTFHTYIHSMHTYINTFHTCIHTYIVTYWQFSKVWTRLQWMYRRMVHQKRPRYQTYNTTSECKQLTSHRCMYVCMCCMYVCLPGKDIVGGHG